MNSKGQAQEISTGKRDSAGIWSRAFVLYVLAEIFLYFPHVLRLCGVRGSGQINLVDGISRQSSNQTVGWILLDAFNQIYSENQDQKTEPNDVTLG